MKFDGREHLDLGDVSVERVVDLEAVPFSIFDIYPNATQQAAEQFRGRLGLEVFDPDTANLFLSFHSLLVRAAGLTILVDTCCGNEKQRPARPAWHDRRGPFLDNLARAGVKPDDIDIVMCTHLHADHVGWNTRLENGLWVPTFANARYLFSEVEYHHWKAVDDASTDPILYGSFADSVLPVIRSGQAELISADTEILSSLQVRPAPGHTPGNCVIWLEGADGQAVLCGDVFHHPVQLLEPNWSTRFCSDPAQSRRTRLGLIEQTADRAIAVLPAHFLAPSIGRIVTDGQAYRFATLTPSE